MAFIQPKLKLKRHNLGLDIASQMCFRKQATELKWLILVSLFSGEVTSCTDTSYCIHILCEVSRSIFSGPPCIYDLCDTLLQGGMKAVVWTDSLQICIMILGILAVVIKGSTEVGGIAEAWRRGVEGKRVEFWE